MKYFFILGRNPTLSGAEIAAFFEQRKTRVSFLELSSEAMLIDSPKLIDTEELMARLGGTIKVGQIFDASPDMEPKDIAENIPRVHGKKSYFGFSFYKIDNQITAKEFQNKCGKIKNLAMPIKDLLAEVGTAARWVTSKEPNLSSVVVKKNKLLTEAGAEIVFLIDKEKIYLGKTLAVQEFEELSFRDYGRPARSMRVGLMPPKLAKVMINLARVDKSALILDPFCGFATILEEAMLWGYENLIGADINAETLAGAKANLEWLAKNFRFPISDFRLLESDVREISKKLPPQSVDAIITEPYLGPPLHGNESPERIQRIIRELSDLYLDAFREFKKVLKPDGKIVIIFPVFRALSPSPSMGESWGEGGFLPILEDIKKIGFTVANPLPKDLEKYSFLKITERNSIIYSRPDQKVFREVLIFKPKI